MPPSLALLLLNQLEIIRMNCYHIRMKTKLTLSVDKDLVQFAHSQAKHENRSVSGLFSDFLRTRRTATETKRLITVGDMVGTLKGYAINDTKSDIRQAYAKKSLR